jgi:hypothetical protein
MAKRKRKYIPQYPNGGLTWRDYPIDHNTGGSGVGTGDTGSNGFPEFTSRGRNVFGFDLPSFTDSPLFHTAQGFGQLLEGMQGEQNAKIPDIFNPMKGFHGFNYATGGQLPQGEQPQGPPDTFNSQPEENYPLKSFLPFVLDDPRNTVNAGKRKPMAIQTEKGEYIVSPHGDIVQVAAKKKHKDMEKDEVTDITSEGNYILSDHKSMSFKKGQKVKGIGMDSLTLGRSPIYYKEGEVSTTPTVYKLSDIEPNKSKYTPADLGKRIARKFPLTTREHDPFATRAQVENKQSRQPYVKAIIALSELKKPSKEPPKFALGGTIGPRDNAIKFNRFQIPHLDDLYRIPKYPDGGELHYGGEGYNYDQNSKKNRRKQYNSWLDQASDKYQKFFLEDTAKAVDATSAIETATVLGQNKYKGHNEYLYGNQYFSRLNNLADKTDRSFGAEQAYFQSAGDRENSVIRQGLNAGFQPGQLAGMRSGAIKQGNERIAGLNKDRRQYASQYGLQGLQATDTFAGRQNQQKSYEVDFENNRLQNLGNIATKNIAGRLAAKSGALSAATNFQLAKTPGNALTDTFKAINDLVSLASNVGSMLTGFGLFGGDNGGGGNGYTGAQGQQVDGTYRYTGPVGPSSQGPNVPWSPGMYGTPHNAFDAPIMNSYHPWEAPGGDVNVYYDSKPT